MIDRLDHLVLTVGDIDATVEFYSRHLGMTAETFGEGRKALNFGRQKLNLHEVGKELEPNADQASPGSADLCFVLTEPLESVRSRLEADGVAIELGPVDRTGALGGIRSIYVRDPDRNLIELSVYPEQ